MPGYGVGVAATGGEEAGLLPALFVASTVKVYSVPLVSPLTSHGDNSHDFDEPPTVVTV